MEKINKVERQFLKIVGVGEDEGVFFDTQNKDMPIDYVGITKENDELFGIKQEISKYQYSGCRVEFIDKVEYKDEKITSKKKVIRVVRENVSYAIEYDIDKNVWTIYITDANQEDYRTGAISISSELDCTNDLITKIDYGPVGPIYITYYSDFILIESGLTYGNGRENLELASNPENYEKVLKDNIDFIYDKKLGPYFNDFLPLLCEEIIQSLYNKKIGEIISGADSVEDIKNRLHGSDMKYLEGTKKEFKEYFERRKRKLTEIELNFLISFGIECDGVDCALDCNVLFDSDTCDTFRFFGTRYVRDGLVNKRISTYVLNGTVVDLTEEIREDYVDEYCLPSNKEIRVIRNDLEYILRLENVKYNPKVSLFIDRHDPVEANSYYHDFHYYINHYNSPEIDISPLNDDVSMFIGVHKEKGFGDSHMTFDEEEIKNKNGTIAFTVEDFKRCFIEEIEEVTDPDIRNEYMYFLPLLSEFIPTVLTRDKIERLSECGCNHENGECEECNVHIANTKKVERLKSILEKFNAYIALQTENSISGAKQKLTDEVNK